MKRIIAFSAALLLSIFYLAVAFSVSADETAMTNQEYYAAQSYLIAKYKDGEISYSEYQERSQAVTDEFVTKNTIGGVLHAGALNASNTVAAVSEKIGSTVQKYGDSARDYINDYISNFMDSYTVLSDKPTVDLNGSGCLAVVQIDVSGVHTIMRYVYGDYGIVNNNPNGLNTWERLKVNSNDNPSCYAIDYVYNKDGSLFRVDKYWADDHLESIYNGQLALIGSLISVNYYGDWRYNDNTQAPTDDTFETISDYDFSEASDMELENLLKKILEAFELNEPDLSTMEGLLNAIYARLGTLDSDDDNELLASINSAVLALVKSNDDNNEALLEELLKFREDLKNGTVGTDTSSHGHEISGTLYNVIPLDKNWLNKIFHDKENLKVQYEGKTYYLEDCGCLKLDDKFYSVDMNYEARTDVDYDLGFDESDLNFSIKDNQNFYDVDFGTLNDLYSEIQSKNDVQTYSMRKSSPLGNDFVYSFSDILTGSQERKVGIVADLIEQLISVGVPFRQIKDNFSTFETIIFKRDYTPKDLVINYSVGHSYMSVTILSYKWFNGGSVGGSPSHGGGGGSFGGSTEHEGSSGDIHGGGGGSFDNGFSDDDNINSSADSGTEYFTKYSKVVRAFTSILISFSWVLSMYKKMSNLI